MSEPMIENTDGGLKTLAWWDSPQRARVMAGPVRRITIGLILVLSVVSLGVIGYMLSGWSWLESLYMVVITVSGVGYGEVHPIDTPGLRWMTIGLIVLGYLAAIYTVGEFAQLIVDSDFRRLLRERSMSKQIEQLKQHVIICGFGRMGSKLAEALAAGGKPLLVIDQERDRIEAATACGYLAIEGNATEEQTLLLAGIERAAALTTVLSNDVTNLFITLTAHELNPKLEILARAEQTSSIKKLRQVGAAKVILPATIGADRLAHMILRPSAESLLRKAELPEGLNDDLASLGLRLDELEIQVGSPLIGGTLADLKIRGKTPFLIVAIRHADGDVHLNPPSDLPLALGDCVVILGHEVDIPQLCDRYALHSELDDTESEKLIEAAE